jgi:hypothetical protein
MKQFTESLRESRLIRGVAIGAVLLALSGCERSDWEQGDYEPKVKDGPAVATISPEQRQRIDDGATDLLRSNLDTLLAAHAAAVRSYGLETVDVAYGYKTTKRIVVGQRAGKVALTLTAEQQPDGSASWTPDKPQFDYSVHMQMVSDEIELSPGEHLSPKQLVDIVEGDTSGLHMSWLATEEVLTEQESRQRNLIETTIGDDATLTINPSPAEVLTTPDSLYRRMGWYEGNSQTDAARAMTDFLELQFWQLPEGLK